MKKTCLLFLPFLLAPLTACGNNAEDSAAYFDSMGDSLLSASKSTYYRAYSDNLFVDMGLKYEEDGETKKGSVKLDPLAFDLRVDSLFEPSIRTTNVSFLGYNKKPTHITLGGDFEAVGMTSLDVKPRLYVEDGTVYSDLSDAGVLRLMINQYLGDYFKSTFPVKAKLTTGLPGGLSYDFPEFDKQKFVSTISQCYDVASSAFGFAETDGIKTVTFSSTNKEQLRLILKVLQNETGGEITSVYDSVSDDYELTSFEFSLSYTSFGPTTLAFSAGILLDENLFPSFQPDGEWKASGKVNFAYGETAKAYTVDDPDAYTEVEIVLPSSEA